MSTYSERIFDNREVWIAGGRIAAVKPAGAHKAAGGGATVKDVAGGIIAPGLVDPHIHIESSIVTTCAYAEAALVCTENLNTGAAVMKSAQDGA